MKQYCAKFGENWYAYIYPSISQVRMRVDDTEPIYEIDIVKTTEPTHESYWGWIDNYGEITMIRTNAQTFGMCFTYGVAAEEAKGNGKAIRVDITEIGVKERKKMTQEDKNVDKKLQDVYNMLGDIGRINYDLTWDEGKYENDVIHEIGMMQNRISDILINSLGMKQFFKNQKERKNMRE